MPFMIIPMLVSVSDAIAYPIVWFLMSTLVDCCLNSSNTSMCDRALPNLSGCSAVSG